MDCGYDLMDRGYDVGVDGLAKDIRDESARAARLQSVVVGALLSDKDSSEDPPIYILVHGASLAWYKIHSKPLPTVDAAMMSVRSLNIIAADVDESWDECSIEDEIERLSLPPFPGQDDVCASLSVVDNTLYLIGGIRTSSDPKKGDTVGFQFIQLNPPSSEWQFNQGYDGYEQFGSVFHGGYIYTAGRGLYRLRIGVGDCEKLPDLPGFTNVLGDPGTIHLLGVGDSGLYVYTFCGTDHRGDGPNVLHYLDLRSMEWTVNCCNFWGNGELES